MRDPVALAWSGRVQEALPLARAQAADADPSIASQGLEALAVLGSQHQVRSDDALDELLRRAALEPRTMRRAFEAATALGSHALLALSCDRLRAGTAGWEVLRHAGELALPELAEALDAGWERLAPSLRDEAIRTAAALPCGSRQRELAFARRARTLLSETDTSLRTSALVALRRFRYRPAAADCHRLVRDDDSAVAIEAARTLRVLSPSRAKVLLVDALLEPGWLTHAVVQALRGDG